MLTTIAFIHHNAFLGYSYEHCLNILPCSLLNSIDFFQLYGGIHPHGLAKQLRLKVF